jgi:hypothetical protein
MRSQRRHRPVNGTKSTGRSFQTGARSNVSSISAVASGPAYSRTRRAYTVRTISPSHAGTATRPTRATSNRTTQITRGCCGPCRIRPAASAVVMKHILAVKEALTENLEAGSD